ncbi:MAG: hypothetical protein R3285_00865 [Kiloniellales bacterium]|nr:hypothetical protein [Kiloniellales bacterium]
MDYKTCDLNDEAERLVSLMHAFLVALDKAEVMPIATSVAAVRAWAETGEHLSVGAKRFMHDVADLWETEAAGAGNLGSADLTPTDS